MAGPGHEKEHGLLEGLIRGEEEVPGLRTTPRQGTWQDFGCWA